MRRKGTHGNRLLGDWWTSLDLDSHSQRKEKETLRDRRRAGDRERELSQTEECGNRAREAREDRWNAANALQQKEELQHKIRKPEAAKRRWTINSHIHSSLFPAFGNQSVHFLRFLPSIAQLDCDDVTKPLRMKFSEIDECVSYYN
jgi:hypothetical protein